MYQIKINTWLLTAAFMVSLMVSLNCATNSNQKSVARENIRQAMMKRIDLLDTLLAQTVVKVKEKGLTKEIQKEFYQSRLIYKQIEFLITYFMPATGKQLNGPALDKVEENDPNQIVITPQGFQAIETILFPKIDESRKEDFVNEITNMRSILRRAVAFFQPRTLEDIQIFDAIKLELVSIITLSISGFDSPLAFYSIPETKAALESILETIAFYSQERKSKSLEGLQEHLESAIAYLHTQNDFNAFDRIRFITEHVNPISVKLYSAKSDVGIEDAKHSRLFNPSAKTIFDRNAFDANYFSPYYNREATNAKIQLGEKLFYDPILSENNRRACVSCHQADKAFTDGLQKALTMTRDSKKLRNTPTILNAAYQASSSYDQKTLFLEDRVAFVVASKDEMHSSLDKASEKLKQSPEYVALFQSAFQNSDAVNPLNVQSAIAAYMRSLDSFNSRFDQYMRGDKTMMNEAEKRGFNLFMGKAKCGTCHFMPLFNGTVPPMFNETEAEVIGVPKEAKWKNAEIDSDVGKMAVTRIEIQKYMFKTPTVRNAELTAPYMHNGVYKTLDEVMQFYNMGGGQGIGIELPNQTLPFDSLALSKQEIQDVIAFMKTLTDTTGLTTRPATLPKFSDAALNRRRIGGEY